MIGDLIDSIEVEAKEDIVIDSTTEADTIKKGDTEAEIGKMTTERIGAVMALIGTEVLAHSPFFVFSSLLTVAIFAFLQDA